MDIDNNLRCFMPTARPATRSLYRVALFTALLSLVGGCGGREASPAHLGTATVSGVASGDAIRLTDGSTVQLRGIDAPAGAECHALVSERLLARILPSGTRVRLAGGYVFKGRLNVNLALVRRGAASAYSTRPPGGYGSRSPSSSAAGQGRPARCLGRLRRDPRSRASLASPASGA